MCWLSSAPTSLPIEPSGPGPPTVAAARERSEVSRWASDRSHSWVQPVPQHRGLQVGPRRPQRDGVGDGARPAPAAAAAERAALVHQRGHRDAPAVADVAEPVRVGDAGVGEVDLVELGLPGQLAQRPGLDARPVHVDDEVRQALVLRHVGVGAREQQAPPRPVRQAGPHLLPVDHPVVAVAAPPRWPARPGRSPRRARRTAGTRCPRWWPAAAATTASRRRSGRVRGWSARPCRSPSGSGRAARDRPRPAGSGRRRPAGRARRRGRRGPRGSAPRTGPAS